MSEFAPRSISGSLGAITQFAAVIGIIIGNASGLIVPLENDSDALTSRTWRIVFILPAIFCLIQLVMFTFIFRYDTPKYYMMKGDQVNYQKVMKCIYLYEEGELSEENQEDQEHPSIPDEDQYRETAPQNHAVFGIEAINNENENEGKLN